MRVYSGKATRGVMLDLIWGTVILMISILLTFLLCDNLNLLNILFLTYFWGLTIALFYHLHLAITEKRLEINEMGVFLYSKNRLIKKMYWNDVASVGTSFLGGKYPRIGFFLTNRDGKVMNINDRDVIGPESILKEAFKEVASIAAKKGIEIDDPLGWTPPGVVGGLEIVDPSRYKGKIHRSKSKRKNTFLTLSFIILFFVVGVSMYFMSLEENFRVAGIIISLISLLFLIIEISYYFSMPDALYFDDEKIVIFYPFGKKEVVWWREVANISCVERTGRTTIVRKMMFLSKSHVLDLTPDLCKSLKTMHHKR